MELPITIVFEPPSRAELRALLRNRWLWLAAAGLLAVSIGILLAVTGASRAEALATAAYPTVSIRSRPPGAEIWLDGRVLGRTPAAAALRVGPHRLELKAPDAAETDYRLNLGPDDVVFEPLLWRRRPVVTRLRPAVPGATLSAAHLTPEGAVNLVLGPGPDHDLHAWRFEPSMGAYAPVLTDLLGARLSVSPDGARVAYVGREIGQRPAGLAALDQVLWLASATNRTAAPSAVWHAPESESLVDVSWAPTGDRLLATTALEQALRAVRSRLWLVEPATGVVRLLFALPSQVVPGAIRWSPDGQRVAFLVHAGRLNALCLLSLAGEFRYLADLEPSDGLPLPYAQLTWSADGRQALFVAPPQDPAPTPATWMKPSTQRVLYLADVDSSALRILGEADASLAAWREDGQLLALNRSRDGVLGIDLIGDGARPLRLVDLALTAGARFAAEWDAPRGRMLVASQSGGDVEYFLIRFALEDHP